MRKTRKIAILVQLLLAVSVSAFAADPGITVSARQRYPWNGLVDLNFIITGTSGTKYDTSFTAKDMLGNTNITMATVRKADGSAANVVKEQLTPGTYNWVWDAAADLPDGFECDRVTIEIKASDHEPLYMVIDLMTGERSYLFDVSDGGWTDMHKISLMVLRKIAKGSNPAGGVMPKDMWVGVFEFTQGQAKTLGVECGDIINHDLYFSGQEGGVGDCKPVNCSKVCCNGSMPSEHITSEHYSHFYCSTEKQTATQAIGGVFNSKESGCSVTSHGWPEYGLNVSGPHYHFNACRVFVEAE